MGEAIGERRSAGRRRDPRIEPEVNAAVVRVYARAGWNGLTFEAVAREAGVGKPSIYRRWESREDLLIQAIDTLPLPIARDRGTLRADLLDYAHQWVAWYDDPDRGQAGTRLAADCRTNPALAERYATVVENRRLDAARAMTRRAIERGEIGPDIHSSTIADLLVGSLNVHWYSTPANRHQRLRETFHAYAEHVVDIILSGVAGVAPPDDPT